MDRNWKWLVPVICVVVVAGVVGLVALIFGLMKSSDAYIGALARARSSPAAVAALGAPIKEGFFVLGNIRVGGNSGRATLQIPVSGPKGSATLHVDSDKTDGAWHFRQLVLVVDQTGEQIDLLAPDKAAEPEKKQGNHE